MPKLCLQRARRNSLTCIDMQHGQALRRHKRPWIIERTIASDGWARCMTEGVVGFNSLDFKGGIRVSFQAERILEIV